MKAGRIIVQAPVVTPQSMRRRTPLEVKPVRLEVDLVQLDFRCQVMPSVRDLLKDPVEAGDLLFRPIRDAVNEIIKDRYRSEYTLRSYRALHERSRWDLRGMQPLQQVTVLVKSHVLEEVDFVARHFGVGLEKHHGHRGL